MEDLVVWLAVENACRLRWWDFIRCKNITWNNVIAEIVPCACTEPSSKEKSKHHHDPFLDYTIPCMLHEVKRPRPQYLQRHSASSSSKKRYEEQNHNRPISFSQPAQWVGGVPRAVSASTAGLTPNGSSLVGDALC
jgi:hypothetical protein